MLYAAAYESDFSVIGKRIKLKPLKRGVGETWRIILGVTWRIRNEDVFNRLRRKEQYEEI